MKGVTFQNDGLVDLRAVTTFGVSSKETSNPIGYFGTGLKYAIAVLLRLGCEIELYLGEDTRYVFRARKTRIRVDDFDVVTMTEYGGETVELAFTTQLGRNWEAWQAFRELWCNAIDEGGDVYPDLRPPRPGATTIHVTGEPVVETYHKRDTIMLTGEPKWRSEGVDVHYKRSAHGYYRGIRALNLARGSTLTYNIVGHSVTLTEDRTIEHSFIFDLYVRNAIANASDERFLIEVIEAPRDSYEASINFADTDLGPAILRLLDGAHFSRCHNHSLLRAYEKARGRNKTPRRLEPDRNEEKTLSRALELLGVLGINVEHYPIVVTDELEDNVLGLAHDRKIFVNRRTFMQGVKMVAGTVYEEYLHLHHGLGDETRAMQNYLIDALMTAGEMLKGEPA